MFWESLLRIPIETVVKAQKSKRKLSVRQEPRVNDQELKFEILFLFDSQPLVSMRNFYERWRITGFREPGVREAITIPFPQFERNLSHVAL